MKKHMCSKCAYSSKNERDDEYFICKLKSTIVNKNDYCKEFIDNDKTCFFCIYKERMYCTKKRQHVDIYHDTCKKFKEDKEFIDILKTLIE